MRRTLLLVAAAVVAGATLAAAVALDLARGSTPRELVTLPLPLTGLLILFRRPGQLVGWCLYALGVGAACSGLSDAVLRITSGDGVTVERVIAAGLMHVAFGTMLAALGFLLLLFPTGRPRTSRWRWATRLVAAAFVLLVFSGWLSPDGVSAPEYGEAIVTPGALDSATIPAILAGAGFVAIFISYGLGVVSLVLRWVRAGHDERAQLKWFGLTAGGGAVLVLLGSLIFTGPAGQRFFDLLILPLFAIGVPVSIALAVLKYRLYDIDVIINRALVYTVLTAVSIGAYAGGVLLFRTLFDPVTGDNDLAIAASTLAVAAMFGRARRRIQAFIDRRFYRSRYDAQQTLEAFSARLRQQVDLDAVSNELLDVVSHTVQPAHSSLWVRPE